MAQGWFGTSGGGTSDLSQMATCPKYAAGLYLGVTLRDGTGACVLCTGAVRRRRALTRHSGERLKQIFASHYCAETRVGSIRTILEPVFGLRD